MAVVISMLRGVNVGGKRKIKMEALRALYESLGLRDAQTLLQSGNVVFRTERKDLVALTKKIESAIERKFGFHSDVVLRTQRHYLCHVPRLERTVAASSAPLPLMA